MNATRRYQPMDDGSIDKMLVRILLPVIGALMVYLLNDLNTKINKALDNQTIVITHIGVIDQKFDNVENRIQNLEDRSSENAKTPKRVY